jgi:hypothetical protein
MAPLSLPSRAERRSARGRALKVLGPRFLRLVLLDHDQPVRALVQGVHVNTRFLVHSGDGSLEGRHHLLAVLGDGKGRHDRHDAHVVSCCQVRSRA